MSARGKFRPNEYLTAFIAMTRSLMAARGENSTSVSREAGHTHGWLRSHYHTGRPWQPEVINQFAKALALSPRDTVELHFLSARALGFAVGRHQL